MEFKRDTLSNQANPVAERILRPRYLCFLREEGEPAELMSVDEWIARNKSDRDVLSYVFVAYTAEQFQNTPEDNAALAKMADVAARNAGVKAYWIGASCMPEPENLQEDVGNKHSSSQQNTDRPAKVYRICDVIRGAHSLAIAVGRPVRPPQAIQGVSEADLLLHQWGKRVWTFPEVLLAPAGKDIKVYTRDQDLLSPDVIPKNQFAAKAWREDAHVARQVGLNICTQREPLANGYSWSTTTKAT